MRYLAEITPFRAEVLESDMALKLGDRVIFKSREGIDVGSILRPQKIEDRLPYGEVLRLTTGEDLQKLEELREYADFCLLELKQVIGEFRLPIKPVFAHCQFDEERVVFYFTAEKRVEFRKLHRYISQKLNKRVVIKQIGARDYTRIYDGIGPCGRDLCCANFLVDFKSVSLRMARNQRLYLSASKLSGICGRLLCCLNFEEDSYR